MAYEGQEYTLHSDAGVFAPGIVRWAINGAKFARDYYHMLNMLMQVWGIPNAAAAKILRNECTFDEKAETVTVIVTAADKPAPPKRNSVSAIYPDAAPCLN